MVMGRDGDGCLAACSHEVGFWGVILFGWRRWEGRGRRRILIRVRVGWELADIRISVGKGVGLLGSLGLGDKWA